MDNSNVVSGEGALKVTGGGYQEIISTEFHNRVSTPFGSTVRASLYVGDTQPNPYWVGGFQLFIDCPSGNLSNVFVGQCELAMVNVGLYNEFSFTIPLDILDELNSQHEDISIKLVLNTNTGSGPYLIDAVDF